jgi:hypothetical protein
MICGLQVYFIDKPQEAYPRSSTYKLWYQTTKFSTEIRNSAQYIQCDKLYRRSTVQHNPIAQRDGDPMSIDGGWNLYELLIKERQHNLTISCSSCVWFNSYPFSRRASLPNRFYRQVCFLRPSGCNFEFEASHEVQNRICLFGRKI